MLEKIYIYYPSFEKGGATKILIKIVNFFLEKNYKINLFSFRAKKNNFIKSKNLKIVKIRKIGKLKFLPLRWNLAISSMVSLYNYSIPKNNNFIIFSMQSHILSILISIILKKKIIIRNSEEIFGATKFAEKRINRFTEKNLMLFENLFIKVFNN